MFPHGIPSEDILDRVILHLDSAELGKSFESCLSALSLQGKQLSIDGKALRETIPSGKKKALVHIVNAWVNEFGVSFGQVQVADKSNELEAIPKLLDQLDCQGSIITIDAMGCQKKIVEKILSKKADYLITLKANQGNLYEEVRDFFKTRYHQFSTDECLDLGHGRGEKRKVYICSEFDFVDELKEWSGVYTLVMVERERHLANGKVKASQHYYLSSLKEESVTAKQFNEYLREH